MPGQVPQIVDYFFDFLTGEGDLMEWAWNEITLDYLREQFNPSTPGNEHPNAPRTSNQFIHLAPFRRATRVFAVIQEALRSARVRVFFLATVQFPARRSNWIHGIHADLQADGNYDFVYPPNPPTRADHRWGQNLVLYRQWMYQCWMWMELVLFQGERPIWSGRNAWLYVSGLPAEWNRLYDAHGTDVTLIAPSVLRLVQNVLERRSQEIALNDWAQQFFNVGVRAPGVGDTWDRVRAIFDQAALVNPAAANVVVDWMDRMATQLVVRVQQALPDLAPVPERVAGGTFTRLFILVAGVLVERRAAGAAAASGACGSGSPKGRRLLSDPDCGAAEFPPTIVAVVERRVLSIDVARQFRVAAVGDITFDGCSDLVLRPRQQYSCTSILLSSSCSSQAPFPSIQCLATNTSDAVITYGDLNGDGFMDQLIRNGTWPDCGPSHFGIVFGARNGSATRYECISSPRSDPTESVFIVLARDDISANWLVSQSNADQALCPSQLTLLQPQWTATGPYSALASCITSTPLPSDHSELLPGDFDGDGQDDLFFICDNTIANCNGCLSRAGVLFFTPAATVVCFPQVLNSESSPQPGAVRVVDITGDGVADVVLLRPVSSLTGSESCPVCGQVAVYPSNASSTAAAVTLSWPDPYCTGPKIQPDVTCHVGDLNADGWPDLLVAHDFSCGEASSSYWLSVNGTSVFSEQRCMSQPFASISPTSFSTLIDLDRDGADEILSQASDEEYASVFVLPLEL